MLTTSEFKTLTSKSESSILDFKKEFYDFRNKSNETAKFIKDVISYSNTIRNETAYIIFGIKEKENGELDLIGLDSKEDDAILQEKARNKIFPKPIFKYYTIRSEEKLFGILEFPVTKYDSPLSPTEKMKGLEPGKFYFRNGTSNTEATGKESIKINDWFKKLPSETETVSLTQKISDLLIKLSKKEEKLSKIISEVRTLAIQYKWNEIIQFCNVQLKGIRFKTDYDSTYRNLKVYGSLLEVGFDSNPFIHASKEKMRSEMNELKDVFKVYYTFTQSLIKLEDFIERFEEKGVIAMTVEERSTRDIKEFDIEAPFYIYCLEDDYKAVYNNIRQKTIDLLMEK